MPVKIHKAWGAGIITYVFEETDYSFEEFCLRSGDFVVLKVVLVFIIDAKEILSDILLPVNYLVTLCLIIFQLQQPRYNNGFKYCCILHANDNTRYFLTFLFYLVSFFKILKLAAKIIIIGSTICSVTGSNMVVFCMLMTTPVTS